MKVYYLNDEQKPVVVRILDRSYDAFHGTGDTYCTLQAAEGKLFDVNMLDTDVPYIKKWKDMVMISYIEASVVPQLVEEQPSQGEA